MIQKLCAVIVTFNPDLEFENRVARNLNQLSDVIIVDNGSGPLVSARLDELCKIHSPRISLINNKENLGVAKAFNLGVAQAIAHHFAFALLLDQDSELMDNFSATLWAIYETFPNREKLAVLAADYIDPSSTKIKTLDASTAWIRRPTVISSGSFIPLKNWVTIGGLNNSLFIDHVDDDYCLRARKRGYEVIQTQAPLFIHKIGNAVTKTFLWRTVTPMNQSAFRWYHVARNSKYLVKRYLFSEPAWVWEVTNGLFRRFVKMLLYEDQRREKLQAIIKGWRDEKNLGGD